MIRPRALVCFVAFVLLAGGCAKRSASLPGDGVSEDGSVTLTPAKLVSTPRADSPAGAREPLGAIESRLFLPELVMDHQGELAIDGPQRAALLKEIERGQAEMVHLQWDLQGEKEKLVAVLDAERVDESASRAAADRVMERENKVKSAHLAMLVKVKNLLTPAQQRRLRELRGDPPPRDGGADAR